LALKPEYLLALEPGVTLALEPRGRAGEAETGRGQLEHIVASEKTRHTTGNPHVQIGPNKRTLQQALGTTAMPEKFSIIY